MKGLLCCVKELLSIMVKSSNSSDVMTLCTQLFVELPTQVPNEVGSDVMTPVLSSL